MVNQCCVCIRRVQHSGLQFLEGKIVRLLVATLRFSSFGAVHRFYLWCAANLNSVQREAFFGRCGLLVLWGSGIRVG